MKHLLCPACQEKMRPVEIGTITIATSGAFTFATTGGDPKTVAAGSLLTVVAPATPVASAANAVMTLVGTV